MKSRAAKFVVALIAAILSSANGFAAPDNDEKRADTCLTSPREYAPPGTRWRYRVERGTGRHCWFLKDDAEKTAAKTGERSTAATEEPAPAPPRRKSATPRSVSEAHAEFSQTPVEQDSRPAPEQSAPAPAASAAAPAPGAPAFDNNPPSAARTANMLDPAAASRWPAPMSTMNPAANPAATSPAPPAEQSAEVRAAPAATPPAKPQPMPRAVPPVPATEKPMSLPMLITVIVGGLSVLGVLVSLLLAWVTSRRNRLRLSEPVPPLELSDTPRRPGDLYRERKRLRTLRSGRSAA
jgi:hypothetical protein